MDGNFYGTTLAGGPTARSTVFKLTSGGALTTLHSFCSNPGCSDGGAPYGGLIQASDGSFYGTVSNGTGGANGLGSVFKMTQDGKLATLYSFCSQSSNCPDGQSPEAGLIQGSDGSLYGTTSFGGLTVTVPSSS